MNSKENHVGVIFEQLEPRLLLDADPLTLPHVIDDGASGFAVIGSWSQNTDGGYEQDYLSSSNETGSATWTFTDLTPGYQYQVWATWAAGSDRASNVYYTVINHINDDTEKVLDKVTVDQRSAPDDFTDETGTVWEELGEPYLIRGTTLSIQLSGGTDGTMVADAIRIVRVGQWIAPIGVPTPEFGIEESHWMYADSSYTYDYGNGPEPYHIGENGPYTHYIDNTDPNATDTDNPFGTPDKPRLSIPRSLPAGSVVEIHNGTNQNGWGECNIGGVGTAENPIFIRGIGNPRMEMLMDVGYYVNAKYIIIEGLSFYRGAVLGRVDSATFDTSYIAVRNCDFHGDENGGGFMVVSWTSNFVHDVVLYNNKFHDNGIWDPENATGDQDNHGVAVGKKVSSLWIVDNEMYHNSGDGVQINASNHQETTHHIYLARNISHHNKQSGLWTKQAEDVIFSQNIVYGLRASSSAPGPGMGYQYAPEKVWFLFNDIYDCEYGIAAGSDSGLGSGENIYIIGNVIHNIHHHRGEYNPNTSWSQAGIMLAGGTNHYIMNNTIYDADGGINGACGGLFLIKNNIISEIAEPEGNHIFLEYSSATSVSELENNLFYQNGDPIRIRWGSGTYDLDGFRAAFPEHEEGCIAADPLFIDAAEGNFHLKNEPGQVSPAINAGASTQGNIDFDSLYGLSIDVDFDGVPRPQGANMDIGAFEAIDASPPSENTPPIANDLNISTDEDNPVSDTVTATDVDGDSLSFVVVDEPAHGLVLMDSNGAFTYRPKSNWNGSDVFTYKVSDGNGGTDEATVNITVLPVNDAPIAVNDEADTNSPATFNVLLNDFDVDGDTLTVVEFSLPEHGDLVYNGDGNFTYTPCEGFWGVDTFSYVVSDGNGGQDVGNAEITVGMTVSFDARNKAQFVDADGQLVTVSLRGPGYGELYFPDGNQHDVNTIVLTDTTDSTTLTITTGPRGSATAVGDIIINGSLRKLTARTTDLIGSITVSGTLGNLWMRNLRDASIDVNTGGGSVNPRGRLSIRLNRVIDSDIRTNGIPISSLRVSEWLDTDEQADLISAPWIGALMVVGNRRLDIEGDFEANLYIDGAGAPRATALSTAWITGDLKNSDWNIVGAIGRIFVKGNVVAWNLGAGGGLEKINSLNLGDVINAEVELAGSIGSLSAKRWLSGRIEAGTIRSLKMRGDRRSGISGDFGAEMILNGSDNVRYTLSRAKITGDLKNSDWNIVGAIGRIFVKGNVVAWNLGAGGGLEKINSLNLGDVINAEVELAGSIGSLSAKRWLSGRIEAGTIRSLKTRSDRRSGISGDFGAHMVLNGSDNVKYTLGQARITGNLVDAYWNVNGETRTLSVKGLAQSFRMESTGGLGRLTVGATDGSDFLFGCEVPEGMRHATTREQFTNLLATVRSVRITGIRGVSNETRFFRNSNISAARIGRVSLLNGEFDAEEEFGLFAADTEDGNEIGFVSHRDKADNSRNWDWSAEDGSPLSVEHFLIRIL